MKKTYLMAISLVLVLFISATVVIASDCSSDDDCTGNYCTKISHKTYPYGRCNTDHTCTGGGYARCIVGSCGAECDENTDCSCAADHCDGPRYMDYPEFGRCGTAGSEGCLCQTGTATGEDCEPALSGTDNDSDGWDAECGDCDDLNADINPDKEEICDNLIDEDCDGSLNNGCVCTSSESRRECIATGLALVSYNWNYAFCGDAYNEKEPDPECKPKIGENIGTGISPKNSCPEITDVKYFVHTWTDNPSDMFDVALARGWAGRSYAFEGESIGFEARVEDKDGIINDCVKVAVTLDNGYDPIEAGCTLVKTEPLYEGSCNENCELINEQGIGIFHCLYTVEPAESGTYDEYWISVRAEDQTCGSGKGCIDEAPGVISLFLNPVVSMTISSQDRFGFLYDEGGDVVSPAAGSTIYSPYFTIENTAQPNSGLYMLTQIYGTDMLDYESSAAKCPVSNILKIENVDYMAKHLNVQQDWTTMHRTADYIFDHGKGFAGNFLGVGDDITMRLRLNIPSPCKGDFLDNGQIIFVGKIAYEYD